MCHESSDSDTMDNNNIIVLAQHYLGCIFWNIKKLQIKIKFYVGKKGVFAKEKSP